MDSDGEQNSPEGSGESYEKFRGQRRNTDFSQADNDLKRFLSEREENKEGSSENIQPVIRWEDDTFFLFGLKSFFFLVQSLGPEN